MITLAGEPLGCPTAAISELVRNTLDLKHVIPWTTRPNQIGKGFDMIPYPIGEWMNDEVEVNTLHWSTRASRWAYGFFLSDGVRVERIRVAAYGEDGLGWAPVLLRMRSARNENENDGLTLETMVYLLDVRPITGVRGEGNGVRPANQLFLLTVVDVRYLWQFVSLPNLSAMTPWTWAQLINDIGVALGVTLYLDEAPSAAFAYPDRSLLATGRAIPYVLDAVASNLGWTFVRQYDGTCRLRNATTGLSVLQTNMSNPLYGKIGGDWRWADVR